MVLWCRLPTRISVRRDHSHGTPSHRSGARNDSGWIRPLPLCAPLASCSSQPRAAKGAATMPLLRQVGTSFDDILRRTA